MVTLCLIFWETARLFSEVVAPLYISTISVWGSQFLHILSTICYYIIAFLAGVMWYVNRLLIFISLIAMTLNIFSHTYWSFLYISWRNSYSDLPTFIIERFDFLLVTCNTVFILLCSKYKSLTRFVICKNFFPSCLLSFYFLDDILELQKFLIFMKYNVSIFYYCCFWFWCHI